MDNDISNNNICDNTEESIKTLINSVNTIKAALTEVVSQIKALDKKIKKEKKSQSKQTVSTASKTRKPTGLALPTTISNELADFMKESCDKKIARTDVTSYLIKYIKSNNLQDKDDKRNINPDEKLDKLFLNPNNEKITFFNLQKFINHHFLQNKSDHDTKDPVKS
tara:strand:+ start:128 stop:625 length:498 start_codon:yes stop_codon:yes gene_type:complete